MCFSFCEIPCCSIYLAKLMGNDSGFLRYTHLNMLTLSLLYAVTFGNVLQSASNKMAS